MADENRARWTKLVADFESCDLSQREFAEERGLSLSNLRYWLYLLRKESRPLRTEPERELAAPKQAPQQEGSRLLPVRVVASAPKARTAAKPRSATEGTLELALPSGTRLRFPIGTDPAYLRSLAAALQAVLSIPRSVRIYIAAAPTDMRRSIDGLMAIVTEELREDAMSGHLFVFLSRRADRVKILTWDNGGFVLYYKRLEQGRFRPLRVDPSAKAVEICATQLLMLLDGIDVSRVRHPKHWKRPEGCPMDIHAPT